MLQEMNGKFYGEAEGLLYKFYRYLLFVYLYVYVYKIWLENAEEQIILEKIQIYNQTIESRYNQDKIYLNICSDINWNP